MACSSYYKFRSEVKKQKGVDNPERFLMQQVQFAPSPLTPLPQGEGNGLTSFIPPESQVGERNSLNPENPINQIIKLMSQTKKNFDISDVVSKLRNKKSRKDK